TMEISYYSDLAIENSKYGNITATGKVLEDGMIANNHLDFGTNVYIEGEGLKVVEDRGSNKYFSKITACDVLVPRNPGESSSDYYKRVNNKGRKQLKGYVLEIGDEKSE
ncbi:MAG: 3D domain-containing protein, partial [Clostridium sp.]